jgi:hypothetical protein
MLRSPKPLAGAALALGLLLSACAQADLTTTLFFDDFESADPAGTFMPDKPPVGPNWLRYVPNSNSTIAHIDANPESEAANSSALAYFNSRPSFVPNGTGVHTLIAPLDVWARNLVASNQNARVEFKYYDYGLGGTNPGLSLIVNELATPGSAAPTGFAEAGLSFNNQTVSQAGAPATGIAYTHEDWHTVQLDFDFNAQNYRITFDGTLSPAVMPFVNSSRTTITNLWIAHYSTNTQYYIDDVRVTTSGPEAGPLKTWNANASGTWVDSNNWVLGYVPNAATDQVLFGSVITAPRTVAVDTDKTVNTMTFSNANTYAIAGPATISLAGTSPTIEATEGSHQLQTKIKLEANSAANGNGGTLDFNNQINLNGKTLTTTGSVNINHSAIGGGAIVNSGILGTGGATPITGAFTSTGTLDIDISGTGSNQIDMFNITGAADLQGFVDVDVLGSFAPTGNVTILTASAGITLSGALSLTGPDAGLFSGVSVVGNNLVLNFGAAAPTGDYNHDGVVDAGDYVIWRKTFGQSVTAGTGADGNGNGTIDNGDLSFWRGKYGNTVPGSGSGTVAAAVPEPAALGLCALGLVAFAGCRLRNGSSL